MERVVAIRNALEGDFNVLDAFNITTVCGPLEPANNEYENVGYKELIDNKENLNEAIKGNCY